jgi:hypothetical protein
MVFAILKTTIACVATMAEIVAAVKQAGILDVKKLELLW